MNPAPLPQPAPFTCPNCGEAMDSQREFCPRCGAQLGAVPAPRMSLFVAIALGLGLLVFGGIDACGALVTISSFQVGGMYQSAFLMFSLPSLLVGLAGFWACLKPFLKRKD